MWSSPERSPRLARRSMLLLATAVRSLVRAQDLRIIPPDPGAPRDPGLTSLLRRIADIVSRKDHRALESLMSPDFRVEFDFGKGPQAFNKLWHPTSAASRVWEILQRLLSQGGVFHSDTLFALPYTVARFPFDLDPLRHVVAVRANVELLLQPRADAERAGSLDHAIVETAAPFEPPVILPPGTFIEISHPTIGRCFVSSSDVYAPSAHRAFFEKRAGRWVWISLAAATLAEPPELDRLPRRA